MFVDFITFFTKSLLIPIMMKSLSTCRSEELILLETLILVLLLSLALSAEDENQEYEVDIENKPFVVRVLGRNYEIEKR